MDTKQMIAEIRKIIARCKASEKAIYEALLEEAESWQMRMDELEEDDG